MAVYTKVSEGDLAAYLQDYDIGQPRDFQGIADGVENSNFYLETERSRYILTLYEKRVAEEDLPFFMALMHHLADKDLPTAGPIANRRGEYLGRLNDRPAALIEFLDGQAKLNPQPADCAACGDMLARLQIATADFDQKRENNLSLSGWQSLADKCRPDADRCAPGLARYIQDEIAYLARHWPDLDHLPHGVVHADLFPDNVLFSGPEITGVIDFYFSGTDFFAYDLAVCLNAWSFDEGQTFKPERAKMMLDAFTSVKPLTDAERDLLPLFLRGASLRFLLTRLYDWLNQSPDALVVVKDPLEYFRKSQFHRETPIWEYLND